MKLFFFQNNKVVPSSLNPPDLTFRMRNKVFYIYTIKTNLVIPPTNSSTSVTLEE
jgi:hypothetical protein